MAAASSGLKQLTNCRLIILGDSHNICNTDRKKQQAVYRPFEYQGVAFITSLKDL